MESDDVEAPQETHISVGIFTTNPEHVVRASEVLGRAAAGLVLEGIDANLHLSVYKEDA